MQVNNIDIFILIVIVLIQILKHNPKKKESDMLNLNVNHPLASTANMAAGIVMRQMVEHLVLPKASENGLLPNGGGLYILVGLNDGTTLARFHLGSPDEWPAPYDDIAIGKFDLTVEHQMPTREIQQMYPELAEGEGNTYYWGSWIDGGLVVACSGVDPEWDEAFSKMVIAIMRAMLTKKQKQELLNGDHFRK